ncbi:30S ribosomal protein S5 [Candidatus Marsarchaeota archaeon]|nr:30S ribosomal protein S5 [Candidatus Marsarchaeota archaeon]
MQRRRNFDKREEKNLFNIEDWTPITEIGKRVKSHEITSIEQIFHEGKRIEEREIVDALLPDLKNEIVEIMNVQRMTKNNRKAKFRVISIVGDGKGHVGIGAGKNIEVRAAIESSVNDAKMNIIPVIFGCGSWQCQCGTTHSLPITVKGKCSSIEVILKPAPRGLGIVASKHVKKMLELAGVKDLWSFSSGRTRSRYNMVLAVYRALQNINHLKNIEALEHDHAAYEHDAV